MLKENRELDLLFRRTVEDPFFQQAYQIIIKAGYTSHDVILWELPLYLTKLILLLQKHKALHYVIPSVETKLRVWNIELILEELSHIAGLLHWETKSQNTPQRIEPHEQIQHLHEEGEEGVPIMLVQMNDILEWTIFTGEECIPINAEHHKCHYMRHEEQEEDVK